MCKKKELIDPYTAIVVTQSGAKIKLDQNHLETVIPAIGRKVLVLSGQFKGLEAKLLEIKVEEFKADLLVDDINDIRDRSQNNHHIKFNTNGAN